MKPSVGRVVHFHTRIQRGGTPSLPQAAMIVEVDPELGLGPGSVEENQAGVYLAVFTRACATFPGGVVRFHPDGAPGSWRWPPREQPAERVLLAGGGSAYGNSTVGGSHGGGAGSHGGGSSAYGGAGAAGGGGMFGGGSTAGTPGGNGGGHL